MALDKVDLYFQVARDRYQSQEASLQQFDLKATATMSVGGVLLGAGVVYVRFLVGDNPDTFPIAAVALLFTVVTCFVMLSALCILGTWLRAWRHNPTPSHMATILDQHTDDQMIRWVGDEYSSSVESNRVRLQSTANYLRLAMAFLIVEALALTAMIFVSLFCV